MSEILKEKLAGYQPRKMPLDYPEAGILVPVTRSVSEPEIVLTQRADHVGTHQGQVAFPGGMKSETDRDISETALRETEEEVALPRHEVELITPLSQVVSRYGILVSPFVGLVPEKYPYVPDPAELDSVFHVPVSWLTEDRRHRTDEVTFRDWRLFVPCYRWKEYDIWGLSAIVLVEFLNAAYDAGIDITKPPSK